MHRELPIKVTANLNNLLMISYKYYNFCVEFFDLN